MHHVGSGAIDALAAPIHFRRRAECRLSPKSSIVCKRRITSRKNGAQTMRRGDPLARARR
jgi:hypothetical protein